MSELRKKMIREMQFRNYSPRTIRTYTGLLGGLSKYYNQSPANLSIEQVKDYLHYCVNEKNASVSFVNQIIGALKILYQDVLGRSKEDISIKRPQREKKLPIVLSKEEVNNLLQTITNLKHKALISIIYSSGLRISEVIALRIEDIDSERMQVRVEGGKGNKDRYTLLSETTLQLLRDYFIVYKPSVYLFNGQVKPQYTFTSIRNIYHKAKTKANIKKAVTVHSLRHSFATHLLEQGVNIQVIQKLLGHANVKTTCTYLHVQKHMIENVRSPLDNDE